MITSILIDFVENLPTFYSNRKLNRTKKALSVCISYTMLRLKIHNFRYGYFDNLRVFCGIILWPIFFSMILKINKVDLIKKVQITT